MKTPFYFLGKVLFFLALAMFMTPGVLAGEQDFKPVVLNEVEDKLFVSNIYRQNKPFNYVVIRSDLPTEGLSVNFSPEAEGEWQEVDEIGHDDGVTDGYVDALMFSSPTQTIQFRLEDPWQDLELLNIRVMFDYTEVKETSFVSESSLFAGPLSPTASRTIVSRAQWGADESWRKWLPEIDEETGEPVIDEETGEPEEIGWYGNVIHKGCEGDLAAFPDELAIEPNPRVKDEDGDWLLWPEYISKNDPTKLVVHHTASIPADTNGNGITDRNDYDAIMRAIYSSHARTRGWGDIGYNYVIAPDGTIYEGRAGGEKVIGGHVACYNANSIGVSLMGNFQEQGPTQAAMDSLVWILGTKAELYNIDPDGASVFRGAYGHNIVGHLDLTATACPGYNLYNKLEQLRLDVAEWVDGQAPVVKRLDYDAEFLGETQFSLSPGETREMTFEFKNEGIETWENPWLHVSENRPNSHNGLNVISQLEGKYFVAATALLGQQIKTGETATFKVTVDSDFVADKAAMRFSIVTGSFRLLNGSANVAFESPEPDFGYQVVENNLPKNEVLFQGEAIQKTVTLKNTGNLVWEKGNIALQKSVPMAGSSLFSTDPVNSSVLGRLQEDKVLPGETGTFQVDLKMPVDRLGIAQEALAPIVGGEHWLKEDSNNLMIARVNVQEPFYSIDLKRVDSINTMLPGERQVINVALENKGNLPLKPSLLEFELINGGILMFNPRVDLQEELPPGETAILSFLAQSPYEEGEHSFYVRGNLNGFYLPGGFLAGSIQTESPTIKAEKIDAEEPILATKGEEGKVTLAFKNTGNTVWRNNGEHPVFLNYMPKNKNRSPFYHRNWLNLMTPTLLTQTEVKPGEIGEFTFNIDPASGGEFEENYRLVMKGIGPSIGLPASYAFEVEGEVVEVSSNPANLLNASILDAAADPLPKIPEPVEATDELIEGDVETLTPPDWLRIKINHDTEDKTVSVLTADTPFKVTNGNHQVLFNLPAGDEVTVEHVNNGVLKITHLDQSKYVSIARVVTEVGGVVDVLNMERRPGWTDEYNYKKFRGNMEFIWLDNELVHINELRLEQDYLPGLAEFASSTHPEKRKAIMTAARSYAYHYSVDGYIKFPGQPYHGSDSPAEYQKYEGYEFELRAPVVGEAVKATEGMMVTYLGEVVKPPYHSSNTGFTLDPMDVWGWSEPYLKSVPDPDCEGKEKAGHGVGMSGCGSEARAQRGDDYKTIIEYYYPGATVTKVY